MLTTRQAFSLGRQPQQSSPIHEPASTTTKQHDRHLAARPQEDRGNNLPSKHDPECRRHVNSAAVDTEYARNRYAAYVAGDDEPPRASAARSSAALDTV